MTVNYSFLTALHVDAGNQPDMYSLAFCLADYEGGRLFIAADGADGYPSPRRSDGSLAVGEPGSFQDAKSGKAVKGNYYCTKAKIQDEGLAGALFFSGRVQHATEAFKGERICVLWYTHSGVYKIPRLEAPAKLQDQRLEL
ncbi:unnamed protein product, partial [Amoebophrya sp. A25]|eukprot:GSA25T00012277001.1